MNIQARAAHARQAAARPAALARDNRYAALLTFMGWLLVLLPILPKDFVSVATADDAPAGQPIGLWLNWCLWLFLLIAGPALVLSGKRALRLVFPYVNRFYLAFLVLILASMLWSAAPGITFERFRRFFILDAVGLAFVLYAWKPHRFQQTVRPVALVLMIASIVLGIFAPELAITQSDALELKNAWHGVTLHKNIFGSLATYGVILYFHGWLTREVKLIPALIGFAISITSLTLARSSTSMLAAAFSIFLLLLLLRSPASTKRYMPYVIGLFVALVTIYALVILGFLPMLQHLLDPISAATGKQASTATGRAPIWDLMKQEIARHPWFGIGYGAFWTGPIPGTASYVFLTQIYFYAWSAHNGYLEVTNDLGYVGLACLIGYIWIYLRDCLKLWKIDRGQAALFLALLFHQGLENLSEAEWMQVAAFNCAVMSLATFALARALADAQVGVAAVPGPPRRAVPAEPSRRSRPLGRPAPHYRD
jgi:O-antigen ligase